MQQGPAAEIAEIDVDPPASQRAPSDRWRRALPLLAIGAAAYFVTLIVTLPARFIVSANTRWAVSGTIWDGEAVVDGAYRLQWRWAPWRSLSSLAFAADIRMTGNGTDIAGSATMAPGRLRLDGLAGNGDGGLLAAFGPTLPFACTTEMQIDLRRLVMDGASSGAAGEIRSDPGSCTATGGGEPQPLPPLVTRIARQKDGSSTIVVTEPGQDGIRLFSGQIAGGRLRLAPTDAGVVTLPFTRGLVIDEAM